MYCLFCWAILWSGSDRLRSVLCGTVLWSWGDRLFFMSCWKLLPRFKLKHRLLCWALLPRDRGNWLRGMLRWAILWSGSERLRSVPCGTVLWSWGDRLFFMSCWKLLPRFKRKHRLFVWLLLWGIIE